MEVHLQSALESIKKTLLEKYDVLWAHQLLVSTLVQELEVPEAELGRLLEGAAVQDYWHCGFKLFLDFSKVHHVRAARSLAVMKLVEIASMGSNLWEGMGGVELKWTLRVVEAWAQYIRCFNLDSSCYAPEASQYGAQDPHAPHLTLPQPGISIEESKNGMMIALSNLIRLSCSASCRNRGALSPGCEPMALHRHPDVLLCMRVVSWHETPHGKQLLAWSLIECYDCSEEERSILLEVENCSVPPMLVLDDEESTSRDTLEFLSRGICDRTIIRQNDGKDHLLVIVVIGRVLLSDTIAYEWRHQSHLRLVFFGFQRWPVPKHYASLVSQSREVALLFTCKWEGSLSLWIRYLQLELVPPHQMTPEFLKALKEVVPLQPIACDYLNGEDLCRLREQVILGELDMHAEECPPFLRHVADRLRLLKQRAAAAQRAIPAAAGRFVRGQRAQDEGALAHLLEPQQLVPLLESLQIPLRPAGLQVAKRKQVREQDQEVQRLLSTGYALPEQLALCSEPQLGSQRGQQLCGVLLRCEGLSCVDLLHCSFTGHGSLCSLFVAAVCFRVEIQHSCFEGGGRGVEVQCVRETLMMRCLITDCLLEGFRCPSSQEVERLLPDVASMLPDTSKHKSAVYMGGCRLSLLAGGGVVLCQGLHCKVKREPHEVQIDGCGLGIVLGGGLKASGMADGNPAEEETHLRKLKVLHPDTQQEVLHRRSNVAENAWQNLGTSNVVMQVLDSDICHCSGPAMVLKQDSWLHSWDLRMLGNSRQPCHVRQAVDIVEEDGSFYWWLGPDTASMARNLETDTCSLPALVATAPEAMHGPLLLPHLLLTSTPCCTDLGARQARLNAAHSNVLLEVLAKQRRLLLMAPQGQDLAGVLNLQLSEGESSYTECVSEGDGCLGDAANSQSSQQDDSGAFHDLPLDELPGLEPELPGLDAEALLGDLPGLEAEALLAHGDGTYSFDLLFEDGADAFTAAQFRRLAEAVLKARSHQLSPSSSS
ncbi:hypothetical protein DUNSADRAFT_15598 [Dunaliella salina]|uniref:Uncharacterized protein n=1 Tax=Dunaliella salina TaxID=3046 RepID=A0ABQ7H1N9_DUNSA|nr:hypothetical protein DUNSADRAFT_15598 [Dunaliella salina]|eukprot:KAF5840740.1 hypothetical protein DUNSADRAFT_15598 [Dunaliella salina]